MGNKKLATVDFKTMCKLLKYKSTQDDFIRECLISDSDSDKNMVNLFKANGISKVNLGKMNISINKDVLMFEMS